MSNEIKPGSLVRVRSGGPIMTVDEVAESLGTMSAWCVWFDGKKQEKGVFPLTVLEIVDPKQDKLLSDRPVSSPVGSRSGHEH